MLRIYKRKKKQINSEQFIEDVVNILWNDISSDDDINIALQIVIETALLNNCDPTIVALRVEKMKSNYLSQWKRRNEVKVI